MSARASQTAHQAFASIDVVDYTKAILNILEDFSEEKYRLEGMQRAVLNILEDSSGEKGQIEDTQRAAVNILEDFSEEKYRLEMAQRAMLNLLEDFDVERSKTEVVNLELQNSIMSLRLAKETTEAVNRDLESFAYSVSHDLRTPLRGVVGFSQLLLEDYSDKLDEGGRDYLRRIVAATEKMGWLIDDLLKLSRVSMAAMDHGYINLSIIARKVIERLEKNQPERQVDFIVAKNLMAKCDEHLLAIVLENLFGNAWKFSEKMEKAVIEFGTEQLGNEKVYFVRDNGTGFDMAFVNKLFNPFQRLHRIDEFPGTGIGLATVKRIIVRHGGRVWIEGEQGKGTTVFFTLG